VATKNFPACNEMFSAYAGLEFEVQSSRYPNVRLGFKIAENIVAWFEF
jgi:hypothetical protein